MDGSQIPVSKIPANPLVDSLVAACRHAKRELVCWEKLYGQDGETTEVITEINKALAAAVKAHAIA